MKNQLVHEDIKSHSNAMRMMNQTLPYKQEQQMNGAMKQIC